jgi:hypothetical protein
MASFPPGPPSHSVLLSSLRPALLRANRLHRAHSQPPFRRSTTSWPLAVPVRSGLLGFGIFLVVSNGLCLRLQAAVKAMWFSMSSWIASAASLLSTALAASKDFPSSLA